MIKRKKTKENEESLDPSQLTNGDQKTANIYSDVEEISFTSYIYSIILCIMLYYKTFEEEK